MTQHHAVKEWEELSEDTKNKFLMYGQCELIIDMYYNASNPNRIIKFSTHLIDSQISKAKNQEVERNGRQTKYLYSALGKHDISNKSVVVIGSETPFYESVALAYGASPTTVEYSPIHCPDNRIKCYTVDDFFALDPLPQFDAAISISSIEHSGLGRYGDEIDPDADIKTMRSYNKVLKNGGLFFLSVPYSKQDKLRFNGCRIYGEKRFSQLIQGWELIDSYGFGPESPVIHEPLWVLKNESN